MFSTKHFNSNWDKKIVFGLEQAVCFLFANSMRTLFYEFSFEIVSQMLAYSPLFSHQRHMFDGLEYTPISLRTFGDLLIFKVPKRTVQSQLRVYTIGSVVSTSQAYYPLQYQYLKEYFSL